MKLVIRVIKGMTSQTILYYLSHDKNSVTYLTNKEYKRGKKVREFQGMADVRRAIGAIKAIDDGIKRVEVIEYER